MHFSPTPLYRADVEPIERCPNTKSLVLFWGIVLIVSIIVCFLIYGPG